jgi:hypothetical protein
MPPARSPGASLRRIDWAVIEARVAVRDRLDLWAPVLFTQLREGRAW